MTDWIVAALVVSGGLFAVVGSIGLLRMQDVLVRMHASTKIGTLACGLVMAGAAVGFGDGSSIVRAVLILVFLLLTTPIGSHMIGRAAVTTGVPLWLPGGDRSAGPQPGSPADPHPEARDGARPPA